MLLGKNGRLAIVFLAAACATAHPPDSSDGTFGRKQELILEFRSSEFEVLRVVEEDGAVRVDLTLTPPPLNGPETRRRALNALTEIQALIGYDDRLAVWVYQPVPKALQGMAFYSPLSEQYHFKTAGELR
jgi:hypothetical protein